MGRKHKGPRPSAGSTESASPPRAGRLTVNRRTRSGHYQGTNYSEVYWDGKVYVYTAWDDNADEVGKAMPFEQWVQSLRPE